MNSTVALVRKIVWFVLSPFRLIVVIKLRVWLCFCEYDCRNEFDGFGRLPLATISFASFWALIQLIVVTKLHVLVVFS